MYNRSMTETMGNENPSMDGLPSSLMYGDTLPRGFASSYKIWRVNPETSYNIYNPSDIIRFIFETQDYIDPYNSFLEIEVEFNPSDYLETSSFGETNWASSCPIFMLDGPATSLIDELIIYSNSREVERVELYDHVGYLMYDLNVGLKNRLFKPHEGTAFYRPMSNDNGVYTPPRWHSNGNTHSLLEPSTTITNAEYLPAPEYNAVDNGVSNPGQPMHIINNSYYVPGQRILPIAGMEFRAYPDPDTSTWDTTDVRSRLYGAKFLGFYNFSQSMPMGRRYNLYISADNEPEYRGNAADGVTRWDRASFTDEYVALDGSGGVQGTRTRLSGYLGHGHERVNNTAVSDYVFRNFSEEADNTGIREFATEFTDVNEFSENSSRNIGFLRPYSAGSAFNFSAYFAPLQIKHTILNGVFYASVDLIAKRQAFFGFHPHQFDTSANMLRFYETRQTFYVPILSGCLGTMIPEDEWKLIPGAGCGQMLFEWRFNEHAFFASGPNFNTEDMYNNNAKKGVFDPQRDEWEIKYRFTKVEMVFELWNFGPSVDALLRERFSQGIYLTSQMITQGPVYQVESSSQATNSWEINNGIPSLRTIFVYFLSNEYEEYNWCRKHYRLSRNITQMELKLGENYIPETGPIRGHAGELFKNSIIQHDFLPFYTELQVARGNLFSLGRYPESTNCDPYITPEEFVVDERPYQPSQIEDIMCNQALFHETRCRGEALYTINLLSDPFDNRVLTGVDTTNYRPFEIRIESSPDIVSSPTQSTMYVMLHHDFLVEFTSDGIKTAGEG